MLNTIFLSTPSARRATDAATPDLEYILQFLSTPSARRATGNRNGKTDRSRDFYPRPPRGERQALEPSNGQKIWISIHALREESDDVKRAEAVFKRSFLSTPSARRATAPPSKNGQTGGYFYPRPPRGERRHIITPRLFCQEISIHALREESDADNKLRAILASDISIHALREESDDDGVKVKVDNIISIHALREESDILRSFDNAKSLQFLSTPSARRATFVLVGVCIDGRKISIHALREESDPILYIRMIERWKFLSTPSARRATQQPDQL